MGKNNPDRIVISLSSIEKKLVDQEAKSVGLKPAQYAKMILIKSIKKES